MNEKHMTFLAIAMAGVAVLYAFKKPKQKTEAEKQSPVMDWADDWDRMMQGLSLENGMKEYNQQLGRMGGLSVSF